MKIQVHNVVALFNMLTMSFLVMKIQVHAHADRPWWHTQTEAGW